MVTASDDCRAKRLGYSVRSNDDAESATSATPSEKDWLTEMLRRAEEEVSARDEHDETPFDYLFGLDH